ncbi:MAG TPA: pyridoxal 5'-phosphate synthase glutaminase subunit PdxT [Solirubrobacteraceae bacterium]
MAAPTVGVLALQGDVAEHAAAFEHCGVSVTTVRNAEELAGVDALALPGGESTTMSRLLRVFHLEQPLQRRLESGMPCFATCAGMILLSRAISDGRPGQIAYAALDIAVRRNGYGRQVESFEADLDIPALGADPYRAVFIRAPLVEDVGPAAEVVAEFDGRPVAVAQGPHLAFAFHPEMTADLRLHRLFLERVATG